MSKDKLYLQLLKKTIRKSCRDSNEIDEVTIKLSNEVTSALNFLDTREEFWKQMKLANAGTRKGNK